MKTNHYAGTQGTKLSSEGSIMVQGNTKGNFLFNNYRTDISPQCTVL